MATRTQLALLGLFLAVVGVPAGAADLDAGQKIVQEGNGKGATACISCHGANGSGSVTGSFPRLAHLEPSYLAKQLRDFQAGTRKDAVMQPLAKSLSETEIAAVTAYFGAQRAPTPATTNNPASLARGARLALSGLWDKDIPACVSCHGPGARGVGTHFPGLAGQHASYITKQLNAWRAGTRANDPQGLMKGIAQRLPAADIAAVSAYLASLPAEK